MSEIEDYRVEVLIHLRKLERLDKDPFSSDERVDAEEVCVCVCVCVHARVEVHQELIRRRQSIYAVQSSSWCLCTLQISEQRIAAAKEKEEVQDS